MNVIPELIIFVSRGITVILEFYWKVFDVYFVFQKVRVDFQPKITRRHFSFANAFLC